MIELRIFKPELKDEKELKYFENIWKRDRVQF